MKTWAKIFLAIDIPLFLLICSMGISSELKTAANVPNINVASAIAGDITANFVVFGIPAILVIWSQSRNKVVSANQQVVLQQPHGSSARVVCPKCNSMNDIKSDFCKNCGNPRESTNRGQREQYVRVDVNE
jgi:hypothetical protein